MHELLGSAYKVKYESFGTDNDIEPSCNFMKYDEKGDFYTQFYCESGGIYGNFTQELIEVYKMVDELYIITSLEDSSEKKSKITYKFKKDKENENYVFREVIEENYINK